MYAPTTPKRAGRVNEFPSIYRCRSVSVGTGKGLSRRRSRDRVPSAPPPYQKPRGPAGWLCFWFERSAVRTGRGFKSGLGGDARSGGDGLLGTLIVVPRSELFVGKLMCRPRQTPRVVRCRGVTRPRASARNRFIGNECGSFWETWANIRIERDGNEAQAFLPETDSRANRAPGRPASNGQLQERHRRRQRSDLPQPMQGWVARSFFKCLQIY